MIIETFTVKKGDFEVNTSESEVEIPASVCEVWVE